MIKPDQLEPGTFFNWNELLVSYMIRVNHKRWLILHVIHKKDAPLRKEDISDIQDELQVRQETKEWPRANSTKVSF